MRIKKYSILALGFVLMLTAMASPALADGEPGVVDTTQDVLTVLDNITNWMFSIFLALAVMMIVYAAFIYLTAGGIGAKKDSPAAITKAHKLLIYAVVAIAVAVLAKGIVNVVQSIVTTGV